MAALLASLLDPVPLDINTASLRDLESLPGIGPERAAAIVSFRESCGPVLELSDLLGVPGIGPETLEELGLLMTIDDRLELPVDTTHWLPVLDSISDPVLTIVSIDIGEGDATLVRCAGGGTVLIDGGPDEGGPIVPAVVTRLRSLDIDSLDAVVITHPHDDHIGGLVEVVRRLHVGCVYDPGTACTSPVYEDLLLAVEASGAGYRLLEEGMVLDLGVASITVVDAGDSLAADMNESSAVMLVSCGHFRALLAGDISEASEVRLTPEMPPVNFMVAPHHGSNTSAFEPFLRRLRPQIVAVSAGRDNPFGHPHMSVMEKYRGLGAVLLRTDRSGTIFVETDGESVSIRTSM